MDRFTPAGVPIHDCDAFGWGMQGGMLQSPTYIAQRGYACGYRAGLASGGAGGGGGGGDAGWQKALDGEVMPTKPTVSESNAALKKVWRKLGGTVASCLAVLLSFGQTVQTAPLGTLNEDSAVVVDVNLSGVSEEIADASNNVLAAANDFTLRASNDVLAAANDFTLRASNDVLAAANDFTLGASNDVLAAANDFTLGASNNVLAAANKYSEGLLDKVSTNGLRSVTDNVCHVTEPRMWFRGDIEWGGSAPRALENQPSFDSGRYRWTWMISGSEADGFSAVGSRDATSLSFAGMGLVSSTASFTARLQEPTSVSNETFVTTSFVTNGVAEAGRNAYAAAMPSIRDLLAKTNATEISADFATDSLVGRLANDSVGFDVRGSTLVLVDGDEDIWSCENGGGGTNTNDVKALIDSEVGGTNAVKGAVSRIPPWLTAESEEPPTQDDVDGKRDKDDLAVYEEKLGPWTHGKLVEGYEITEEQPQHDSSLWLWYGAWSDESGGHYTSAAQAPFVSEDQTNIVFTVGAHPSGVPSGFTFTATRTTSIGTKPNQQLAAVATGDAQAPSDGDLVKYDAANERFVMAIAGRDYIKSNQDISGKQDKILETGILKGGGAGAILPARPSSYDGETADYRDPKDAKCYESVASWTWEFSDGLTHELPDPVWDDESPVSHWTVGGDVPESPEAHDENATSLRFIAGQTWPKDYSATATCHRVATKGEPFVTTSFMTNRFNKVRAALDSFAGATVSDLVNTLKNALEE